MNTRTLSRNSNGYEYLPVALWLVKDAFWVMGLQAAAVVMIVPTLCVAVYYAWKTRKDSTASFRNVALSYWVAANGMWMTGQFFNNPALNPYAIVLFVAGIVVVASYYGFILPAQRKKSERVIEVEMTAAEVRKVA